MEITYKTCESVCAGHPDKICDQISDSILDACLTSDPDSRVAIECLIKDNNLIIAGEITSQAQLDYAEIARQTLARIGYSPAEVAEFKIQTLVSQQSPSIACGVDVGGAGDQGIMYGYATNETTEMIPLPLLLAHQLCRRLNELRTDPASRFQPDGKAQVTIRYEDGCPVWAEAVVVSIQHDLGVNQFELEQYMFNKVIHPVMGDWLRMGPIINPHFKQRQDNTSTKIYINPTGRFEIGGSYGDCGVTGRKIAVDTYGGIGHIGGGAFSGKDPSKVDRSAAYMARYLAKQLVAQGYCEEVEVRLAYVIGVDQPAEVSVNIIKGEQEKCSVAVDYIRDNYDLSPRGIINFLNLKQPIYSQTASYGHFGRSEFAWEK